MIRPLIVFILCFPLLMGCRPQAQGVDDSPAPGSFTHKTPHLPTTYVDTTGGTYAWTKSYNVVQSLQNRISVPVGYKRQALDEKSFGWWLRRIPLKPGKPNVMLYNGEEKGNQSAHHAVIDLDVGKRDLQQCADAVMRLRAEYLYAKEAHGDISFNFTSGDACKWSQWKQGYRPKISGNKVSWNQSSKASGSYKNFRAYMNMVFNYAGTASLAKELKRVADVAEIQVGDVFIQGGFPGHAILVMDVAIQEETGKKIFMLAQSYMPAQEMHILVNPREPGLSPWYNQDFGNDLYTPEWGFSKTDLRRF